jgi:hypothetical protein
MASRADPAGFVVNEPPGRWNVGEVFFTGAGKFFRILAMEGPPKGDAPEAREWKAVWTVGPSRTRAAVRSDQCRIGSVAKRPTRP